MSQGESKTTSPQAAKTQSFKSQYKLHGIITSVALIWLDFALIYHGLAADDLAAVGGGMVIMIVAVGVGYFFG